MVEQREKRYAGKSVLVTGAGGFIGGELAKTLRDEGADVTLLVKDLDAARVQHIGIAKYGNIINPDFVREAISSSEADVVFHLAASAIVRISARDPVTTYASNVMGTVNVLEACRQVGTKRIVCASSDKAYGDHDILPYREDFSLQPMNTYDTSKACMDLISRSYEHNYDMSVAVTRCSNVYGPGDKNNSRLVPNTIRRVLDGKPPELYEDIEKMEREFIFIDDVVEAYLALGLSEGRGPFNIGGTGPVRIRQVTDFICSTLGRTDLASGTIVKHRETNFKEINRQHINADKLTKLTGWFPRVKLGPGIEQTCAWYEAMR